MCKQHLLDVLWSYTDAYDRYTSAWAENRSTEELAATIIDNINCVPELLKRLPYWRAELIARHFGLNIQWHDYWMSKLL